MSSSKSSSASSSQTSSVNEDNRIVADNGGVALGKDAILQTNDYFSDNVLASFKELVSLVRDAGEVVVKTTDTAQANTQAQLAAFTAAIQNDKQGTTTTEQNIVKYIPLIIVAGLIISSLYFLTRKK